METYILHFTNGDTYKKDYCHEFMVNSDGKRLAELYDLTYSHFTTQAAKPIKLFSR